MKQLDRAAFFTIAALLSGPANAVAGQLHVEPVLLELNTPTAAGTLTIRNDEDVDASVQTRVFRWSQVEGKETLEPTVDVVASPPTVKLAPGADYLIRVVRVTKQPIRGEESYRVIVDRLPVTQKRQAPTINLLIRQSIPVFFRARQFTLPNVSWSLTQESDKLSVVARNDGDERLRIASLRLRDATGKTISFGNGLVGYVLGQSSMSWTAPNHARGFGSGGSVSIAAESDKGSINVVVPAPLRR